MKSQGNIYDIFRQSQWYSVPTAKSSVQSHVVTQSHTVPHPHAVGIVQGGMMPGMAVHHAWVAAVQVGKHVLEIKSFGKLDERLPVDLIFGISSSFLF